MKIVVVPKTEYTVKDGTFEGNKIKIVNTVIAVDYNNEPVYVNGRIIFSTDTSGVIDPKTVDTYGIGRIFNAEIDSKNLKADLYLYVDKIIPHLLNDGLKITTVTQNKSVFYLIVEPAVIQTQNQYYRDLVDGITPLPGPGPITPTPDQESPYGPDGQIKPIIDTPPDHDPYDGMFGNIKPMWEGDK